MPSVRHRGKSVRFPKSLVTACAKGGVTLVLGAGVSCSRGVPTWPGLVERLVDRWNDEIDGERGVRRHARLEKPAWLAKDGPAPPHPLSFQILLEDIHERLARRAARASTTSPRRTADETLAAWMTDALYDSNERLEPDTLGLVAKVLMGEQTTGRSRITRVITFNADSWLEDEVHRSTHPTAAPVLWPVARSSSRPRRTRGADGAPPIPIYHLHGFLPRKGSVYRGAADKLVFTDLQYWQSVATPSSFANRVMMNALYDGTCIFLGISMTDMDLMRWLGIRASEIVEDGHLLGAGSAAPLPSRYDPIARALEQHFWIRVGRDDVDEDLVSRHLRRRGIVPVNVGASWSDAHLSELFDACFPRMAGEREHTPAKRRGKAHVSVR